MGEDWELVIRLAANLDAGGCDAVQGEGTGRQNLVEPKHLKEPIIGSRVPPEPAVSVG